MQPTVVPSTPPPPPPLVPIEKAAHMLGISRSCAYVLARRGELPGVAKLGTRLVVRTAALNRWLSGE